MTPALFVLAPVASTVLFLAVDAWKRRFWHEA
jgi:hypothetical protein